MAGLQGPDLGKRIVKLQKAVEKGRVEAVKRSAEKAKAAQLAVMRSDSGGDLKLSGVGRSGRKIGVTYKVTSSGMSASALLKASGPVQLIDGDTAGHVIRSTRQTGRGRRGLVGPTLPGQFAGGRRAVINIPGIGPRRSARHPGTSGKHTWRRGRADAEPKVAAEMRKSTSATIAQGMKG